MPGYFLMKLVYLILYFKLLFHRQRLLIPSTDRWYVIRLLLDHHLFRYISELMVDWGKSWSLGRVLSGAIESSLSDSACRLVSETTCKILEFLNSWRDRLWILIDLFNSLLVHCLNLVDLFLLLMSGQVHSQLAHSRCLDLNLLLLLWLYRRLDILLMSRNIHVHLNELIWLEDLYFALVKLDKRVEFSSSEEWSLVKRRSIILAIFEEAYHASVKIYHGTNDVAFSEQMLIRNILIIILISVTICLTIEQIKNPIFLLFILNYCVFI